MEEGYGALWKDAQRIAKALQPPLSLADILRPPLPLQIRQQRAGIKQLEDVIDLYARSESQLSKVVELHLTELRIRRERMAIRLAEMTHLRR